MENTDSEKKENINPNVEETKNVEESKISEVAPISSSVSYEGEKKGTLTKSMRQNPWILSTLVLGILSLILIAGSFQGTGAAITGNVVSTDVAADNLMGYLNQIADSEVKLVSSEDDGNMYIVTVEYQGQQMPIYVTKDGQSYTPQLVPLTIPDEPAGSGTSTPTEVVKSDKPVVELFVMSHCPFGTQAEKGFIPAIKVLGDTIDAKIRFVYYAMHPTYGEVEEQLNQYCIQEEQNDKYLDYLECFLEDGDGAACLVEAGIDSDKLATCTEATDKEFEVMKNLEDESLWMNGRFPLFNIHKDLNDEYGIGGSPTLVINGAQVSPKSRSPQAYFDAICESFNDAPEKCATAELSTETYSSGFGWEGSAAAGATAAQCA